MWSALFGNAQADIGTLILRPDPSAVSVVAGFKGGAELRLATEAPNTSVAALLAKLNKYRGPDQQILRIWRETGSGTLEEIVGSEVVRGEMRGIVRAASIQRRVHQSTKN
jgi:hypothetical protein